MSSIAAPGRRVPTPGLHPGHPTPDLTIYTLDALAGAGKTYAIDRHALDLAARGTNVRLVQPTEELIAQTVHDLRTEEARRREQHPSRAPLPIRAITSDTTNNVARDLVEHLKRPDDGQVLLVTHAAFFGCPYWHRKADWTVIVDEVPPVIFAKELNLLRNFRLLADAIEVEANDVLYGRVVARDEALLREIARNRSGDQADALVQDIAERVASGHWDVDVIEAQYRRLLSGGVVDGEKATRGKLNIFGVLRPSVFRDYGQVIVAGACFEASLMYHLWAGRGVAFKPHAKLHKAPRYSAHGNGPRLTLYYATERPWSKHLRDRAIEEIDDEPYTVLDDLVARSRALFAEAPFCWAGNVDLPDHLFGARGKRLPNNPIGLNRYQNLHDVAIVSALNPSPAQFRHLEDRGVDGEAVRTWVYRHAAYQALMRTSLRDAAATAPARAVVEDLGCAEWLAGLFPGSKVERLPGGRALPAPGRRGRPRVHADDAARRAAKDAGAGARVAEHRRKTRDRLLGHLRVLNGASRPSGDDHEHEARVWDDMREGRGVVPGTVPDFRSPDGDAFRDLAGTLCAGKYGEPVAWLRHDGIDAFVRMLRDCHAETVESKERAGL